MKVYKKILCFKYVIKNLWNQHLKATFKRTVHNWTWKFFSLIWADHPFLFQKKNIILLLQKVAKPFMKIGFRSQTLVTHIWNAILDYCGFEVPCKDVSLFTKWPKILCQKYQRFRSFEWPKDDGQCLRTSTSRDGLRTFQMPSEQLATPIVLFIL